MSTVTKSSGFGPLYTHSIDEDDYFQRSMKVEETYETINGSEFAKHVFLKTTKQSPNKTHIQKTSPFRKIFWEETAHNPSLLTSHIHFEDNSLVRDRHTWNKGVSFTKEHQIQVIPDHPGERGPKKQTEIPFTFTKPQKYFGRKRELHPFVLAQAYQKPNHLIDPPNLSTEEIDSRRGPGCYRLPDQWTESNKLVCGKKRESPTFKSSTARFKDEQPSSHLSSSTSSSANSTSRSLPPSVLNHSTSLDSFSLVSSSNYLKPSSSYYHPTPTPTPTPSNSLIVSSHSISSISNHSASSSSSFLPYSAPFPPSPHPPFHQDCDDDSLQSLSPPPRPLPPTLVHSVHPINDESRASSPFKPSSHSSSSSSSSSSTTSSCSSSVSLTSSSSASSSASRPLYKLSTPSSSHHRYKLESPSTCHPSAPDSFESIDTRPPSSHSSSSLQPSIQSLSFPQSRLNSSSSSSSVISSSSQPTLQPLATSSTLSSPSNLDSSYPLSPVSLSHSPYRPASSQLPRGTLPSPSFTHSHSNNTLLSSSSASSFSSSSSSSEVGLHSISQALQSADWSPPIHQSRSNLQRYREREILALQTRHGLASRLLTNTQSNLNNTPLHAPTITSNNHQDHDSSAHSSLAPQLSRISYKVSHLHPDQNSNHTYLNPSTALDTMNQSHPHSSEFEPPLPLPLDRSHSIHYDPSYSPPSILPSHVPPRSELLPHFPLHPPSSSLSDPSHSTGSTIKPPGVPARVSELLAVSLSALSTHSQSHHSPSNHQSPSPSHPHSNFDPSSSTFSSYSSSSLSSQQQKQPKSTANPLNPPRTGVHRSKQKDSLGLSFNPRLSPQTALSLSLQSQSSLPIESS